FILPPWLKAENIMENLDFSEEEIQEQLKILGYKNIPKHRLREFKRDLDELIQRGEWRSLTSPTRPNFKSQTATTQPSPPAFTKEKVRQCYFESDEGFFLHAGQEDNDRQVLTTCQNRDFGRQQPRCDSYAQHSVAPKLQLPPGAPNRLQVEPEPDDSLHPPLTDSYTSAPDSHERRFIKRKVLRKHKGQSLVCDESVYSEDSALCLHRSHTSAGAGRHHVQNVQRSVGGRERRRHRNSLSSSFWSDGERKEEEEEEEEVEIEQVISKEDSKPDDSLQEALKEEKPERDNKANTSEEGGSGDDEGEDEGDVEDEERDGENEDEEGPNEDGEDEEEEGDGEDEDGEDEEEEGDGENEDEEGQNEEEEEGEEEEEEEEKRRKRSCISSSGSPAPSLMTSGYGTYRPEEGGDFRDDHTITEFDQDSRGDLSEVRDVDEEDDCSLCSFGGFDVDPSEPNYSESCPLSVLAGAEVKGHEVCWGSDGPLNEVEVTDVKPRDDEDQTHEEKSEDLYALFENNVTASEERHHTDEDQNVFDGWSVKGEKQNENRGGGGEEELQDLKEESLVDEEAQDKVDSEDQDESSSNKDIKFIDSKVDFNWAMYKKMCEEFEGNLRQKTDLASCLEERLAELHLSPSAERDDFETENEDVTSHSDAQSSDTDGVSLSAFESYIRGMTQIRSDGDIRPKPKSFIRPVMSQPTIKKTDPVAKYFQYKQLWEMFKLPGEKDRRSLRWEIKERLAYQPPPPKPRRVYVPNTYVVPTEKKRSALRWEIRNDLANGLLPHKFNYRF
ncbi:hypothetical protein L3Q82_020044, partial [Scortum barcoo]